MIHGPHGVNWPTRISIALLLVSASVAATACSAARLVGGG